MFEQADDGGDGAREAGGDEGQEHGGDGGGGVEAHGGDVRGDVVATGDPPLLAPLLCSEPLVQEEHGCVDGGLCTRGEKSGRDCG